MEQTALQEVFHKAEKLLINKQEELLDFIDFLLDKYTEESLEEIHAVRHPEPSEKQELEAYLDKQMAEMDAAPESSMIWEEVKCKIVLRPQKVNSFE